MKENIKGITLMILAITIILLLILVSTTVYYSKSSIDNAKLTKFENELKIVQTQVELWEEEGKFDIGEELTEEQKEFLTDRGIPQECQVYYRYITKDILKQLGVEGIEKNFYVIIDLYQIPIENIRNILDNRVISVLGLEYRGTTYNTLKELKDDHLIADTYTVYTKVDINS